MKKIEITTKLRKELYKLFGTDGCLRLVLNEVLVIEGLPQLDFCSDVKCMMSIINLINNDAINLDSFFESCEIVKNTWSEDSIHNPNLIGVRRAVIN
jgi:hypothetical protein